jgi:hypothetical protein
MKRGIGIDGRTIIQNFVLVQAIQQEQFIGLLFLLCV